jgi:eukaryotic-like serine/threonine-protein kinase
MLAPKRCSSCGAEIPPDAPGGLCASCLLAPGLESVANPEPLEPADLTPILVKAAPSLAVKFHSFGDYELLAEVARGGMGVVFRARQLSLNRIVALKFIHPGKLNSSEAVRRFQIEAEATASLDHPNIVPIYEVGEHQGQPYFSMALMAGGTLADRLEHRKSKIKDEKGSPRGIRATGAQPDAGGFIPQGERLLASSLLYPPASAAKLLTTIARAVQHAHKRGILHRDLKPGNIVFDAHDQPHLTDFGLAKVLATESHLTLTADVLGSPHYMAPEQAEGKRQPLTTATDIYSLGCILYELLAGRPPFQGETALEVLRQVREQEPRLVRGFNPAVDRDLETICLKCLQKDPQRRYGSVEALADDLERWIRQEPIQARSVSRAARLWLWCRRKPAMAALLVLLHLTGALGLAGVLWQWGEARRQAARADTQARNTSQSQQQSRRLLYASDMNLAQQSLKLNNLGKARRLLDRHRPQPGEEDLRDWEWRYLWQLTRSSALVTLTNRPVRGFSVSFSPDGTRLAVGWIDGHVDLWDVPGRRWVRALTDREYSHQGRVAFSPVRNLLAATSDPKVVALYDLDSGRESVLWRAPDQGAWDVRDLAFSPDGSRLVIYAGSEREIGDAVWVVNASSSQIESRQPTVFSDTFHHGAARLSPDNRRLYLARSDALNRRYSIQCLDLTTGQELWQTESQRDYGLTALDISPDGQLLASGSGFEDPTIRVWDAATGRRLVRLDGHTGWVCRLAFTKDGRRLISAATDQSIRFWDTSNWTETKVLRGHTDEVHAVAISETAQFVASVGKDGNLLLWKEDGESAAEGYSRLPEDLGLNQVLPLDHSRVLLLPSDKPPELIDLKRDFLPVSLPEIGSSADVLGWFGTNLLCHWNGTNQILVRDWQGSEFIPRGAITLDSGIRPNGVAYNPARQLLAWAEGTNSTSVYLASLAAPGRRIELRGDVPGLVPLHFSEDGNYLAATKGRDSLRAWNVETGQIVASSDGIIRAATFAAGGRVLVVAIGKGNDHEIGFYDLAHPGRAPRRVPGRNYLSVSLAVSPDGGLVASSTHGGLVRLFDPAKGEWIEDLHGHLNAVNGIAFSADGRRLISAGSAREAIKLWDVGTRQELLTLGGISSGLEAARWSADGDVILAGPPWQAWRAPSWEEIAAAENSPRKAP